MLSIFSSYDIWTDIIYLYLFKYDENMDNLINNVIIFNRLRALNNTINQLSSAHNRIQKTQKYCQGEAHYSS